MVSHESDRPIIICDTSSYSSTRSKSMEESDEGTTINANSIATSQNLALQLQNDTQNQREQREEEKILQPPTSINSRTVSAATDSPRRISKVNFDGSVDVTFIPSRYEYSDSVKTCLWTNPRELSQQAERNILEFASEGFDWRNVADDDDMVEVEGQTGRVHPIHCNPQLRAAMQRYLPGGTLQHQINRDQWDEGFRSRQQHWVGEEQDAANRTGENLLYESPNENDLLYFQADESDPRAQFWENRRARPRGTDEKEPTDQNKNAPAPYRSSTCIDLMMSTDSNVSNTST